MAAPKKSLCKSLGLAAANALRWLEQDDRTLPCPYDTATWSLRYITPIGFVSGRGERGDVRHDCVLIRESRTSPQTMRCDARSGRLESSLFQPGLLSVALASSLTYSASSAARRSSTGVGVLGFAAAAARTKLQASPARRSSRSAGAALRDAILERSCEKSRSSN